MNQIDVRTGEISDLVLLDPYEGVLEEDPRPDSIATISAGYKTKSESGGPGRPAVSRDGTIYVSDPNGRAAGLKMALDATSGKRLTIAFPYDNPAAFIVQRFVQYSATALLAYGDHEQITRIDPRTGARETLDAEQDAAAYQAVRRECKVATSIYFALAEWLPNGQARLVFPDGFGLYRLRTTSRTSVRNLHAALRHVGSFTGGRLQGVPFDISLDYRDLAGPDGQRRNVPVWTWLLNPPGGLTSRNFAPIISSALREGRALRQLPPPRPETEAQLAADVLVLPPDDVAFGGDDDEPFVLVPVTDRDAQVAAEGGACDPEAVRRQFFAMAHGTPLADDEDVRHTWLFKISGHTSLTAYLEQASVADAAALIEAAGLWIEEWRSTVSASRSADVHLRAEPPRTYTPEQRRAIERLASPGQLAEIVWEYLTFEAAAEEIRRLQSR